MLDFVILYPIIWFFERKRDGVDGWSIALAVGIPAVVSTLLIFGAAALGAAQVGQVLSMMIFPLIMGVCLWKIVGLPAKRAAVYPVLYLLVTLGIGTILAVTGVIDAP